MKKILLVLMMGIGALTFAQKNDLKIVFSQTGEISLNRLALNKSTKLKAIKKELGKPSSVLEKHSEMDYYFESKGIVLAFKNGVFMGIAVNFNYDGDKKMPKTTYPGELVVGDKSITVDTKTEDLESIEWLNYECMMKQMCMFKNTETDVNGIVGVRTDTKISQIMFMLKK